MESFHLLLQAHWDLERFPIFNLQLPIPNWAAIENWKLKIEDWQALARVRTVLIWLQRRSATAAGARRGAGKAAVRYSSRFKLGHYPIVRGLHRETRCSAHRIVLGWLRARRHARARQKRPKVRG